MRLRASLSAAMLVVGAGLLAVAWTSPATGTSSARPFKQGGTLRVNVFLFPTGLDEIDPTVAYSTASWAIEYSTALKLLNHPDAPALAGPGSSRRARRGSRSLATAGRTRSRFARAFGSATASR